MFALLQIYVPEAADHDDICCCLDVIAVSPSEVELERYCDDYQPRYAAAVAEFDAWDSDISADWTAEHDIMLDDCARKHGVFGSLIKGTRFQIVEALTDVGPARTPRQGPRTQDQAA